MFREMIKIAESNPNILQMELDFIEGNSRARALYEKMGFRITGIKFNSIRQNDGTLCNEYSMIREISRSKLFIKSHNMYFSEYQRVYPL